MSTITITPKRVAQRALPIIKDLRLREQRWLEAAQASERAGYRPHYCIHGTNLWTDYDNICGGCETGLTLHEEALALARDSLIEEDRMVNTLVEYIKALRDAGATEAEVSLAVDPFSAVMQRRYR